MFGEETKAAECAACLDETVNGVEVLCCGKAYCWACVISNDVCGCGEALPSSMPAPYSLRNGDGSAHSLASAGAEAHATVSLSMLSQSCSGGDSGRCEAPEREDAKLRPACPRCPCEAPVKHVASCEHAETRCTQCGLMLPRGQEESHYAMCALRTVACVCGSVVTFDGLQHHKEHDCGMGVVPCPLVKQGCKEKVRRDLMAEHLRQAAEEHVVLLLKHMDQSSKAWNWPNISIPWRHVGIAVYWLVCLAFMVLFCHLVGMNERRTGDILLKVFVAAPVMAFIKPRGKLGDVCVIAMALLSFR